MNSATNSDTLKVRNGNSTDEDAEAVYKQARQMLLKPKGKHGNFFSHQFLFHAIDANCTNHSNPSQGLQNALQLARLATARQPTFKLGRRTWGRVLLQMIHLQMPVDEMTDWIAVQPIDDLTKEMVFVVSSALDRLQAIDTVLPLLRQYLKSDHAKKHQEDRVAALNFLLGKLLTAKPTIRQLEAYVELMRVSISAVSDLNAPKVVAYYLDPLHHEAGCEIKDVASSFMAFLNQNHFAFKWHSSLRISNRSKKWVPSEGMRFDRDCATVEQQITSFLGLPPNEREEYLLAVNGELNDGSRLFEMARKRAAAAESDQFPLDYDLCSRAVFANADDRGNPKRGLTQAIEIAQSMRDRIGFQLPAKTWAFVFRKMIHLKFPVKDMIQWMDTQPVEHLIKQMIYVLSSFSSESAAHRPSAAVVLALLEHMLTKVPAAYMREDRRAALSVLFQQFINAKPSIQQVDHYVALLTNHQTSLNKSLRQALVSFYVNPCNHEPGTSSRDIALKFWALWRANMALLKFHSGPFAYQLGIQLGSCGKDGVAIAKELLQAVFTDEHARSRRVFTNAVLKQLHLLGNHELHAEFAASIAMTKVPRAKEQ